MTDAAITPGAPARPTLSAGEALLKKRHRSEKLFRAQGIAAIIIAMIFLVVLVGRIVVQGYSTFETHTLTVPSAFSLSSQSSCWLSSLRSPSAVERLISPL